MNKNIISRIILLMLLITGTASAQEVNKLYIGDLRAMKSTTIDMPINVENTNPNIVAAQFEVRVPYGITLATQTTEPYVKMNAIRTEDHRVRTKRVSTASSEGNYSVYRFMLLSPTNKSLKANKGQVFSVRATIDTSAPFVEGRSYLLFVENVVLSDSLGHNVMTEFDGGTLYIEPNPDFVVENIGINGSNSIMPNDSIELTWKVRNQGSADSRGGWNEQAYLIPEGSTQPITLSGIARYDGTLAKDASVNRSGKFAVPRIPGFDGNFKVRIKLTPNSDSGEHKEYQGNNTTTGTTNYTMGKKLYLTYSYSEIREGNTSLNYSVERSGYATSAETFSLSKVGDSRVTVPESMTFNTNSSRATFNVNVVDDNILNDDDHFTINVNSGNGYEGVGCDLTVTDNEIPSLSMTSSKSVVDEGDSFDITITAQRAPKDSLKVQLKNERSAYFSMPTSVVIPPGESSVTFTVDAVDDETLNVDTLSVQFTATANNYTKGSTLILYVDNDMPELELTFSTNVVTESAGPQAIKASLKRKTKTDTSINIRLSDDSGGEIYYTTTSITLGKGQTEAQFSLGVKDNVQKEGDRDIDITAAIYIPSCYCSALGMRAGNVTQTITVIDDDGAALTLKSRSTNLYEGTRDSTFTVTRNDSPDDDLAVSISCSYTGDDLDYPATVTIPKGKTSVTFAVALARNETAQDARTLVFTAQAAGYSKGTCWVQTTDQTLPDATISSFSVRNNQVYAGSSFEAEVTIFNDGYMPLPTGTKVSFTLNGKTLENVWYTEEVVDPWGDLTMSGVIDVLDVAGSYNLQAKVSLPDSYYLNELDATNNYSELVSVTLLPVLTATAQTDKTRYTNDETVLITGHAEGYNPANADIEVYLIQGSTRFTVSVKTDENGDYSTTWKPEGNLAGHFVIGACTPDEGLKTAMAEIDVYGMRRNGTGFITNKLEVAQTVEGYIEIINHGSLPLTNIRVSIPDAKESVNTTFTSIDNLPAGEKSRIIFTLTGVEATTSNVWQTFTAHLTSDEGAVLDQTIYYIVYPNTPKLTADRTSLNTTMTKGKTRQIEIVLSNQGRKETGEIQVDLGNAKFLSTATPLRMASLAPDEESSVVLQLTPTEDMSLNSISTGNIYISCANGSGVSVSYRLETVSEETGTLIIDVWDEFTMNTDEAPHVEGATVNLLHPVTQKLLHQAVSGADGLATFENIPEGNYIISVTHPKHNSYKNNISVAPGTTTTQRVFIQYSAITVTMTYEPTEVEDEYDIVTTVVYETNVPKAVVKMDAPDKLILENITTPYIFNINLTNVGLIAAIRTRLSIPEEANGYTFTPLVEGPWNIMPQQMITIPVQVDKIVESEEPGPSQVARPRRIVSDFLCGLKIFLSYFTNCDAILKGEFDPSSEEQLNKTMQLMESCGGGPNIADFFSGGGGAGEPSAPGSQSSSGGGGASSSTSGGGVAVVNCDPWLTKNGPPLIKGLAGAAGGPVGFAMTSVDMGMALSEAAEGNPWELVKSVGGSALGPAAAATGKSWGRAVSAAKNGYDAVDPYLPLLDGIKDAASGGGSGSGVSGGAHSPRRKDGAIGSLEPDMLYQMQKAGIEFLNELHDDYITLNDSLWQVLDVSERRAKLFGEAPLLALEDLPEALDENFPDWYPSWLRAFCNRAYIAFDVDFHYQQMLHQLFGSYDFIYLSHQAMNGMADYINNAHSSGSLIVADSLANYFNMTPVVYEQGLIDFIKSLESSATSLSPDDLSFKVSSLETLAERFNNTWKRSNGETVEGTNYMDPEFAAQCVSRMLEAKMILTEWGYETFDEMLTEEGGIVIKHLTEDRNSVCSKVKLQIEQKLTMTREAVRGTLTVVNGSTNEEMKDVKLNLVVTDPDGNVATSHIMEIHTESIEGFTGALDYESGWKLGANTTGVAKIIFIPTRYAAPTEPIQYTFAGTISFIDPFTGLPVTRDLEVERLTVNPSPVLDLTYFMQRDILGDDPLTEDVVEAMVPSQFSLLINNKGYGNATKVKMLTQQPKIVENERGLFINFEILSSQLNGGDKTLALGEAVTTDFGTIPAHSQAYAQWWMTSTLTGHFVDYDIKVTHVTSYDNPDLTLLDSVTIHELIHQIEIPLVNAPRPEPAIPFIGFMANDEEDYNDYPDMLYLSDGTTRPIYMAANASVKKVSDTEYTLSVGPSKRGWNYGNIADPTGGVRKLKSITRISDGTAIPLVNFWQTDRTLRDQLEPTYENLLHYTDSMSLAGESYQLIFEERPAVVLAVQSISGLPDNNSYTREKIESVTVSFNKNIDPATFTVDDILMQRQGETLDLSEVTIEPLDEGNTQTFVISFGSLTQFDGYYTLTIQTAGITDSQGFNGETGKMAGWMQIEDGKTTLTMKVYPEGAGTVTPGTSMQDYFGDVELTATPAEGYTFYNWMCDDEVLSHEPNYTYPMSGAKTVTAVFQPKAYNVSIRYSESKGTVEGGATGRYNYDQKLTLKAVPKSGYYFAGWQKDGSDYSADAEIEIVIKGAVDYEAVFKQLEVVEIFLSEDAYDNVSCLANGYRSHYIVKMDRVLKTGQWNTFCVPFNISEQQVNKTWGYSTMIVQLKSLSGNTMRFENVFQIKAGVPYLVKPERTVEVPQLEYAGNIIVEPEPIPAEIDGFRYIGNYTPHEWNIGNGDFTEYYFGVSSNNMIPAKETTSALKGMRAYFVLPKGVAARISIGDETVGIAEIPTTETVIPANGVYDLSGRKVVLSEQDYSKLPKGIYIINGKKQVIK